MKLPVFALTLALCAGPSQAQTTPAQEPVSTIRSTASEVLLDVVVRDKRGKPVKNLKAADFAVSEDGVKQEIRSFRVVSTRELKQDLQKQASRTTGAAAATDSPRVLRPVNIVCLVFHNLDPVSRTRAYEAVQEFLRYDLQPETYIGVFVLDDRLSAIHPFTNNRAEVLQAAQKNFPMRPMEFDLASEAVLTANPSAVTVSVAVNQVAHTATTSVALTGGEVSRSSVVGADVNMGSGANALRGDRARERSDFGTLFGMRETDKIITMIDQFGTLPGRKTVLLVTTGLLTTGDPERFQAILEKANQAGVTINALDVTGLNDNPSAQAGNLALGNAAGVSRSQTQIVNPGVGVDNTMGALGAMKQKSRQGDDMESAVRTSDVQASLRALADGTGGTMAANTNDYRKFFQKIIEDVDTHYEVSYHPTLDRYDGRLRKIDVKLARADLNVGSRSGYFAIPDLKGSAPLQPYEALGLAVLSAEPRPHDFDFRSTVFQFRGDGAASRNTLVFELRGTSLGARPNPELGTQSLHASLLALVKDSRGDVVDKFSVDAPYEIPVANLPAVRATPITFTHPIDLPPGHYRLETAVMDREAGKSATAMTEFDAPPAGTGVAVSSAVLVQRIDPSAGKTVASDPLVLKGKRLVPQLEQTLTPDAKPFVYFVVYPDKSSVEKPKLGVEFLVDGKAVANQTTDLPAPDDSGTIPMVVRAAMHTGKCELKITALQGGRTASAEVTYTVKAR